MSIPDEYERKMWLDGAKIAGLAIFAAVLGWLSHMVYVWPSP